MSNPSGEEVQRQQMHQQYAIVVTSRGHFVSVTGPEEAQALHDKWAARGESVGVFLNANNTAALIDQSDIGDQTVWEDRSADGSGFGFKRGPHGLRHIVYTPDVTLVSAVLTLDKIAALRLALDIQYDEDLDLAGPWVKEA